jgi:hypothetical protein
MICNKKWLSQFEDNGIRALLGPQLGYKLSGEGGNVTTATPGPSTHGPVLHQGRARYSPNGVLASLQSTATTGGRGRLKK